MHKTTVWISRTAVLTALLIVLQFATKPLGQIVTGSCVNGILAVAALSAGLWSGLTVALLSPFVAFLLGIGPQLLPIVPAIAAGNAVLVLLLWALSGKGEGSLKKHIAAWLLASAGKFLCLYLLVVRLLCVVLSLPEKQTALFTAMFSWPQLVTALIGAGLALPLSFRLRKLFAGKAP